MYTAPVGLQGEFTIIIRVRSVMEERMASISGWKFFLSTGTFTGTPPMIEIIGSYDAHDGESRIASSLGFSTVMYE